MQRHHQFGHTLFRVAQLANPADIPGHAFQGLGARFRRGHEPAVAAQRPRLGFHRDMRRLMRQDVVPGRFRIASAQADDVMVFLLLPGHLGLCRVVLGKVRPFLAYRITRCLGHPGQIVPHAGEGCIPPGIRQLTGDIQPEIARRPEHLVRTRILMLRAAEQRREFGPCFFETPRHSQAVGQTVSRVGEVRLQLQGESEPILRTRQVASFGRDATQGIHRPRVRRVQFMCLAQQRFGGFELVRLLEQLVPQHHIRPGIPGVEKCRLHQIVAGFIGFVEFDIGHAEIAVGRHDRRVEFNDTLKDADRLAILPLAATQNPFLQQARGFSTRHIGHRLKLDLQHVLIHRQRGIREQFGLVGANALNDLLLAQRSKVCGMKKLEV